MFETWNIGVFIRGNEGVSGMMRRIASSSAAAQVAVAGVGKSSLAVQKQLLMARAGHLQTLTGMFAGGALLGGALAVSGLRSAGQLQLSMAIVQNATHATTEELDKLRQMVMHVSNATAQSADTIASEMAMAARSGLSSTSRLMTAFPSLAKFADVMWMMGRATGQNISPQEAIQAGVQFAHYFQAYSPQSLLGTRKNPKMLDWILRIMNVQPEGIEKLLRQGRYFIPFGRSLGMGTEDIMALLATMGQTGFLLGRGGTSVGRALLGIINAAKMTGFRQNKQSSALEELGITRGGKLTVTTGTGRNELISWSAFMNRLAAAQTRLGPIPYARDVQAAFGVTATQLLSAIETPEVRKQMAFIKARMAQMGSVEDFFNNLINKFLPSVSRAATNLRNILINIFTPLLPSLTKMFNNLSKILGDFSDFLAAHPKIAGAIGWGILGTTLAMVGGFLFTLARLAGTFNALKLIDLVGVMAGKPGVVALRSKALAATRAALGGGIGNIVSTAIFGIVGPRGFGMLASAFARLIPIVGWATLIITGLTLLWKYLPALANWWRAHGNEVVYYIGYGFGALARAIIEALKGLFSMVTSAIGSLWNALKNESLLKMMTDPTGAVADIINAAIQDRLKNVPKYKGPSILQSLEAGASAGYSGQKPNAASVKTVPMLPHNSGSAHGPAGGHYTHIENLHVEVKSPHEAADFITNFNRTVYGNSHIGSRVAPQVPFHASATGGRHP